MNKEGFDELFWYKTEVFALSLQAVKVSPDTDTLTAEHTVMTIEGGETETVDEAIQIGLETAREEWPEGEGWTNHTAKVIKLLRLIEV
jgi:hypothetical protein